MVHSPFGYSESFFQQDCRILREMGYNLVVVPLQSNGVSTMPSDFPHATPPSPLSQNLFVRTCQLAKITFRLLSKGSWSSLKAFYKLEKKDQTSISHILSKIYTNSHFFTLAQIEILIFGYGNLVIERENLAKALEAKMVVGFQGSDIKILPLSHKKDVYRKGLENLDVVFFRNQHLLELAKQQGLPATKRTQIIYNKIDLNVFQPKEHLGFLKSPLNLLGVGRLHWVKGFPLLFQAAAILKSQGFDCQIQIAGDGDEEEHLFYTAMELGILDQVQFLGVKHQPEVKEIMVDSDILINSSYFESNCRALLEAQATGLMVITTNWPEAEKIVLHEETGWLVPKRGPSEMAEQIKHIAALNQDQRAKIAHNAIEHVRKHFNLKNASEDFEKLLEQ